MKYCKHCDDEIPLDRFGKNARAKDGLTQYCKEYYRERTAAYKIIHPDKVAAKDRKYQAENAEYYSQKSREWRQAHPEYQKEYRARTFVPAAPREKPDPEEMRRRSNENKKQWRKKNHDAEKERNHARNLERRARVGGASIVQRVQREEVIARDQSICYLCGRFAERDDIHIDHIVPISRGGNGTLENLAVTHSHCNEVKGTRLVSELDLEKFRS